MVFELKIVRFLFGVTCYPKIDSSQLFLTAERVNLIFWYRGSLLKLFALYGLKIGFNLIKAGLDLFVVSKLLVFHNIIQTMVL